LVIAQEKPDINLSIRSLEEAKTAARQKKVLKKQKALWQEKVVLIALVSFFAIAFIIAYYYTQLTIVGYQISQLEKDLALIKAEGQSLEANIDQLSSLERIEKTATTKLGMIRPPQDEVIVVEDNKQSAIAGQASSLSDSHQLSNTEQKKEKSFIHLYQSHEKKNQIIQVFTELMERMGKRNG